MLAQKEKPLSCKLLCALVLTTVLTAVAGVPLRLSAADAPRSSAAASRPSLLLSITVEGLDADMLDLLQGTLTRGGFRRLIETGLTIEQPQFGPGLDPAAATAVLYTGASPDINGIGSARIYDPVHQRSVNIFTDSATIGNFTNQTLSPTALKVSTFTDQARIDADGLNYVYAVAPHSQQALIMGAHAANSAFWIDNANGKWATSTFYRDIPQQVTSRNYRQPISYLLDTLDWRPALPLAQYPGLPATLTQNRFIHSFPASVSDRYSIFKGTAYANTEVTDLALLLLHYQMLGKHPGVDVLSLAYTVIPDPRLKTAGGGRVETLDSYIRLDRDLQRLFEAVDRQPGADNTLIILSGIPSVQSATATDAKWGLPAGKFSAQRARSLLNMYLIALHGNGDWVTGYHNRHFYLNQKLITQRNLNLAQIRTTAAEFLTRMSGVSHAYTIDDINAGRAGSDPDALRRNTPAEGAGDIIVNITPGWEAVDDISGSPSFVASDAYVPSPVYIAGSGINPSTISEPVDARRIAPTVTRLLRIRSPNGASLPPLRL